MIRIFETLYSLLLNLLTLTSELLSLGLHWAVLIAWTAWWLWGVHWPNLWKALGRGAWAPLVLLVLVSALVWSRLAPGPCTCLGASVGNFWWQLGYVALLTAYTFLLGWIQGLCGWTPAEINLEPAAHADEGHGAHGGHH